MQASRRLLSADLSRLNQALSLNPQVAAALSAFIGSHSQAQIKLAATESSVPSIDFAQYRKTLKNTKAVDDAEKLVNSFTPKQMDTAKFLKIVQSFEEKAMNRAKQTAETVQTELGSLNQAIADLDSTRPVEDLQERDVLLADPTIEERTEDFAKRSIWGVKQHEETFGDVKVM